MLPRQKFALQFRLCRFRHCLLAFGNSWRARAISFGPQLPDPRRCFRFGTMDGALRSLAYAGAFEVSHDAGGIANMAAYLAGDTQGIDTALNSFATTYKLVPKVIGVDHAQ